MDLYSDWKEYSINLITDVHRLWSVRNKTCNASDCVLYFDILTFFINLGITSLHTTPQKNVTKKWLPLINIRILFLTSFLRIKSDTRVVSTYHTLQKSQ